MKQDTVAFKTTECLAKEKIIDVKDYDTVFIRIQQAYAIGYDTGRLMHIKERPIMQMDLSGKQIKVFESITIAHRKLNINRRAISFAADGKYKTSGGFKWKYIDNPKKENDEDKLSKKDRSKKDPKVH